LEKLGRNAEVSTTTALETALDRAQFVVTAVEVGRSLYWAQDYHVPRKYGFRQVFAENGGPGSLFHGLRAMKAMARIARTMERISPDAILLNYTNPMHKVCEAITTLSKTRCVGGLAPQTSIEQSTDAGFAAGGSSSDRKRSRPIRAFSATPHDMMANVRADPGRTQPRAAYPRSRSSNANSLQSQNSAGSPQIYATFQRDNLRRHF
jgi:hypothetical protein